MQRTCDCHSYADSHVHAAAMDLDLSNVQAHHRAGQSTFLEAF